MRFMSGKVTLVLIPFFSSRLVSRGRRPSLSRSEGPSWNRRRVSYTLDGSLGRSPSHLEPSTHTSPVSPQPRVFTRTSDKSRFLVKYHQEWWTWKADLTVPSVLRHKVRHTCSLRPQPDHPGDSVRFLSDRSRDPSFRNEQFSSDNVMEYVNLP